MSLHCGRFQPEFTPSSQRSSGFKGSTYCCYFKASIKGENGPPMLSSNIKNRGSNLQNMWYLHFLAPSNSCTRNFPLLWPYTLISVLGLIKSPPPILSVERPRSLSPPICFWVLHNIYGGLWFMAYIILGTIHSCILSAILKFS